MKKLIVANWKDLPETLGQAEEILDYLSEQLNPETAAKADIIICPPDKYIEKVAELLQRTPLSDYAVLGLQDVELSGENKFGAEYVIIGHSSHRVFESDETVNQKLKITLEKGLIPVVCIGEKVRDGNFEQFLKEQVDATFAGLSADQISKCFIAYEPVWAISTNPGSRPDTPESARVSIKVINDFLTNHYSLVASRYLYGGSVTVKNAHDFLSMPETAGVLVGGVSVRKEEFLNILKQL